MRGILWLQPAGKSTFESQALYSAFVANSRFGSLDPLEKKEVGYVAEYKSLCRC